MARRKTKDISKGTDLPESRQKRAFITDEAREAYLISLAYDRAEERLRDGTASSQEIVHFLKLGSSKDRLEKEIMKEQKTLLSAKTDQIKSQQQSDELYTEVLAAFRTYSGTPGDDHAD